MEPPPIANKPVTGTKPPPGDAPALCEHGAAVLQRSLTTMLSHADGVRQATDIEAIHQMRVWSRHTRAAIETFGPCFAGKAFGAVERDIKTLADVLGAARDLDVMIETLNKRAEKLPPEQRGGIALFVEGLVNSRRKYQKQVVRAMDRLEKQDLAGRIEAIASQSSRPKGKARHG